MTTLLLMIYFRTIDSEVKTYGSICCPTGWVEYWPGHWFVASECGRRPQFEKVNKKDASEDELLASYREKRIVGGDEAEVASAPW